MIVAQSVKLRTYLESRDRCRQLDVQVTADQLISAWNSSQLSLVQVSKDCHKGVIFVTEKQNEDMNQLKSTCYKSTQQLSDPPELAI